MNRNEAVAKLKDYADAIKARGATSLYLFGSAVRDEAKADSDLDLFIDYDPETKIPNMFQLMKIEEEISAALGIAVTITTRNALHPLMKDTIERQAVRVT